jgi:hypothetical protein
MPATSNPAPPSSRKRDETGSWLRRRGSEGGRIGEFTQLATSPTAVNDDDDDDEKDDDDKLGLLVALAAVLEAVLAAL